MGITQAAYPVAEHLKGPLLRHLLRHTEMPLVLVFTRTKHSAKRLAKTIDADGFAVAELHSNLTQAQRRRVMEGFRRGDYQVVVATNIASRGLDVDNITHVISYDVPDVPDDYVHRIGRTARAEQEGDAFVLVSPGEERSLADIERQIGQRLPRITLPDFDYKQASPDRGASSGKQRSHGPRADSATDARRSKPPAATRKPVAQRADGAVKGALARGRALPIVSQLILINAHSCLKRVYRHSFIRNPLTTKHFNTIFFRVSQTGETRKGPDGTGYRAFADAPAQDFERGSFSTENPRIDGDLAKIVEAWPTFGPANPPGHGSP